MPELINTFSWSISAREDFADCHRRRYWAKYAMWNGWKETASPLQKAAYRLSKMENRFTLQGNAVERAALWCLRELQEGRPVTVESAYVAAAKPYLNQCWSESKQKLWQTSPKKYCCLHEHYYAAHHRTAPDEMITRLIAQIKLCVQNFIEKTYPRLAAIQRTQEVAVATVAFGDPESFPFDGVKIYAIPDYVYRQGDMLHIHDWKSGSPKPAHKDQMAIYGLWAHLKHNVEPSQIQAHLEYLSTGQERATALAQADMDAAASLIRESVAELSEYLVQGDIAKNQPLPQEDWELCADEATCRLCNFYELCQPELKA